MKHQAGLRIVVALALSAFSAETTPLHSTTHWVANSSGLAGPHVQNFLEGMSVDPDGKVWTYCGYDEGGNQFSLLDRDGNIIARDHRIHVRSDTVRTRDGVTWKIAHYYGRAFMGNVAPPPVGDSAPLIVSTAGDTIFSDSIRALTKYGDSIHNPAELVWIEDPTALGVSTDGLLMVGSNGLDQNVRLVKIPKGGVPRFDTVRSLGVKGGVFAGPIPGLAGDRRFWGIRGLGMDSSGRVYVGNTGMPMQVGGGTDIRCFDHWDSAGRMANLVWKAQGLAFVNTADFDPDSNGTSVYKNATRFHMDWTQAPGKSWSLAAVTVDPFRHPNDPRLNHSLEETWTRRIGGKVFQFNSDMYGSHIVVTRFEPGSEIGIPVAWFKTGDNGLGEVNTEGIQPTWDPSGDNWKKRWMWVDRNGDGKFQADEFSVIELPCYVASGVVVRQNGDIVIGCGDFYTIPANGLVNGIPGWSAAAIQDEDWTKIMGRDSLWPTPLRLYSGWLTDGKEYRMAEVPGQDAMLVATGSMETYFHIVVRVDHWSDPAQRKVAWATAVEHKFPTDNSVHLDVNSDTTFAPMSLIADRRFLYVNYLDKGPDTIRWTYDDFWYHRQLPQRGTVRGEITVWDMRNLRPDGTPARVGTIVPDTNVGFQAGANDLWHTLNVTVQSDGTRLISAEEDGWGKILIHRWCPDGETCSRTTSVHHAIPHPDLLWRVRGRHVQVRATTPGSAGSELSIYDLRGRQVLRWSANENAPSSEWTTLGVLPSGGVFLVRRGQSGSFEPGSAISVP